MFTQIIDNKYFNMEDNYNMHSNYAKCTPCRTFKIFNINKIYKINRKKAEKVHPYEFSDISLSKFYKKPALVLCTSMLMQSLFFFIFSIRFIPYSLPLNSLIFAALKLKLHV